MSRFYKINLQVWNYLKEYLFSLTTHLPFSTLDRLATNGFRSGKVISLVFLIKLQEICLIIIGYIAYTINSFQCIILLFLCNFLIKIFRYTNFDKSISLCDKTEL